MTKAEQQMFSRMDNQMLKCIPPMAFWHMRHRPYERGGIAGGDDKGETETI